MLIHYNSRSGTGTATATVVVVVTNGSRVLPTSLKHVCVANEFGVLLLDVVFLAGGGLQTLVLLQH